MALDFDAFAILLLLAPFFVALLAPLIARETGPAAGWILAIVPTGICAALTTLIGQVAAGKVVELSIDWVPVLGLKLSFLIDGLSLIFGLAISGIGAIILIYSGAYLRADPKRGRFLAIMLVFMGAMLGLVMSNSLVALFAFWELTAVTSYLLIGHDNSRPEARRAAFQAMVVTGLGGLSLMAGGVLLHVISGVWNISELRGNTALYGATWSYPWVLGFIAVAAFTKSAQIPFHFWLPNAMEAPTPVSAFLHSATMVQAGIYLLARMAPLLSGTALWQGVLCVVGGATLLWGALLALRQSDLKQILAHTTIASLGLMVMLLGFGSDVAMIAVAAYFVAHALYKAALFLVAGILDHETGTRDVTRLSGLRDHLTISFICSALAALSMFGLPPFLGWFAKEEVYAALGAGDPAAILALVVMFAGNALLGASALVLGFKPFMGQHQATGETPREGSFALWIGPAIFGLLSLAVVFGIATYGDQLVSPVASAIAGHRIASHLSLAVDPRDLPLWLSVATWAIAALLYWQVDRVRAVLVRAGATLSWSLDRGFDTVIHGLLRLATVWTRAFHHGRLELYLAVIFAAVCLVVLVPLASTTGWTLAKSQHLTGYEWAAVVLALIGLAAVVFARSRIVAIVALGIQGLALALLFLFFGAPDLALTQLAIEVLSVVILALVMTRLHLSANDPRPLEDWMRDGALALIAGAAMTVLLYRVLQGTFDGKLGAFFEANSLALAHGRNIVNVILVDFRGLDTLGEISVVFTAAVGVLILLRRRPKAIAPSESGAT